MATMTSSKCVFPHLLSMILLVLVKGSLGEQQYDCPKEYLNHGTSCYKFVIDPQLTFQEGEVACRRDHGYLLSVGDASENTYVTEWLKKIDVDRHKWVTSGMRKGGRFKWTSDGTTISHFHFLSDEVKDEIRVDELTGVEYKQIIYKFDEDTGTYTWEWGRLMDPMSYICELAKADLWKLYQNHRDFAFGTGIVDPNLWPVAPNITQQSGDIVFFKRTEYHMTPVTMDCLASGNPPPTYKWYRKTIGGEPVDVSGDNRYSITNGRLNIQKPQVAQDVGEYHCEAINEHGSVLSNPIQLSYGKLDEFPNVATGNYIAKLYMGVEIDCQPPSHSPAIRYNWFRENTNRFIRPDLNKHQFVSKNGKLYISEVGNSDAGDYYCAVFLAPRPGETLASGQPLSRNSLPITLKVQGDNPNMYGPDIQDKFPQLFPEVPLVGQKVQIECLAYGRSLKYNWVRTDAPLNPKAYMVNRNRVLVIDEALLSDSGWYTCVVEGFKSTSNKTRYVSLSGPPSFPIPLQNQFLDMDTPFTWSCLSHGIPVPTYTWYKDSQVLPAYDKDTGVTVRGRHMTFKTVNEQHNGVYECEAVNAHGSRRDSAQLRAISFKPSFSRTPVKESLRASVEGSIMIQCLPEAAPRPDIEWTKDGGSLPSGHVVHPNGALELTTLTTSDSGTYTCQATNSLGTAKSSTQLQISDTTVLAESPTNTVVPINGSTTLRCQASFDSSVSEVMYQWKFFNHVIDFTKEFSYAMPYVDTGAGDLYITAAQYEHEGRYTCIVSTVTDTVQESAYIDVDGPPEEPSGVHRHKGSVDNGPASLELWWIPGKTHKHPISMYIVEFNSDQNDQWDTIKEISDEASKINEEKYVSWRRAVIDEGLSPGGSFRFRVKGGGGDSGYSVPSQPSPYYKMEDAAPVFAPTNVGGGGGSERELQITWDALPRSKWGANKIKYVVYLRRKNGNKLLDGTWRKSEELKTTVYHKTISKEFYYLPYEVKVQAVNDFGAGPNSTMVDVMSAELMPKVLPKFSQANAINATAGTVEWNQVPNTREIVRGSIFGFQVNYWQENTKCLGALEKNAKFTRVYGDVTSADLIGLAPGADYCVNIQILNNAGLGPKTDNYYLGMNDPAPHNYPEYVSVTSHGPESVRVTWRGVIPRFGESPLIGYHAWYWKMGEDIRSAKVVDFGKSMTGVIHGIGDRDIYTLRLMGYSNGGDGKKAPDVRFTLATQLPFDPRTTEVMNACPTTRPPVFLAVFVTVLSLIVVL